MSKVVSAQEESAVKLAMKVPRVRLVFEVSPVRTVLTAPMVSQVKKEPKDNQVQHLLVSQVIKVKKIPVEKTKKLIESVSTERRNYQVSMSWCLPT